MGVLFAIHLSGEGGLHPPHSPPEEKRCPAEAKNFENSAFSLLSLSIIIKVLNPTW